MALDGPMLSPHTRVALVDATNEQREPDLRTRATRDHALIERWAARRGAAPAIGEASASGPQVVDVNDGGVGIRFNFPGLSRFRPISWAEWFEHFDRYDLLFVFERDEAGQPLYSRWQLKPHAELGAWGTLV